ncbi:DUF6520 family protein [Chryseolinea soli]|uniref:DUF2282 domain-containing protein n=1 Tax=Chryseolinea soli TaxID=2321403 RepID=A0A385SND0_9BACT|nr:DUF6520 family protein [Chryseolinea soli]AYB32016.1 hypothetical protein D4L85_16220 [Chryseolinea soli]
MKTARIFLSIIALLLGFAGAVTSKTMTDITNHGVIQNTSNQFATIEANVCDNDLNGGAQCTLQNGSASNAYKVSAPSKPLFRPS